MPKDVWFTELQTGEVSLGLKVREVLLRMKTPFQDLLVLDTDAFGRVLVLDGAIQTTDRDEFVYHEMITHVPLAIHPAPRKVAVVGGGDGGAIREILKHPEVEEAHLIEIDAAVVEASRRFFPQISCALDDPRAHVKITDGIRWIKEEARAFDVIIVDSTDPVGPAEGLFGEGFYQAVYEALGPEGILVAQSESPMLQPELIRKVQRGMRSAFSAVYLYTAAVPTYPSGYWTFSLASKGPEPMAIRTDLAVFPSRYWTPDVHRAAFMLPPMVEELTR